LFFVNANPKIILDLGLEEVIKLCSLLSKISYPFAAKALGVLILSIVTLLKLAEKLAFNLPPAKSILL